MNKLIKILIGTSCVMVLGACFSSKAFSLYTTTPTDKTLTIDIGDHSGYFANVYDGKVLVSSNKLSTNPDNSKELAIKNLSLTKGYKVKLTDFKTWFGDTNSYSHNIAVGCSVSSGLVTETGDYVAVQTGTYDFYFKFNDDAHESFNSVYVKVNETKTYYLQDTYRKGYSPAIHYWGDNVVVSEGDNYWGGTKMSTQEGGKDMYKVLIPANASTFNIKHNDKYSSSISVDLNNAVWFDDNGCGTYNWSNPQ